MQAIKWGLAGVDSFIQGTANTVTFVMNGLSSGVAASAKKVHDMSPKQFQAVVAWCQKNPEKAMHALNVFILLADIGGDIAQMKVPKMNDKYNFVEFCINGVKCIATNAFCKGEFAFDTLAHSLQLTVNKKSNKAWIAFVDAIQDIRLLQIWTCQTKGLTNFTIWGNGPDTLAHLANKAFNQHAIEWQAAHAKEGNKD